MSDPKYPEFSKPFVKCGLLINGSAGSSCVMPYGHGGAHVAVTTTITQGLAPKQPTAREIAHASVYRCAGIDSLGGPHEAKCTHVTVQIAAFAAAAVKAEREACAKLCDAQGWHYNGHAVAAQIRARGQAVEARAVPVDYTAEYVDRYEF